MCLWMGYVYAFCLYHLSFDRVFNICFFLIFFLLNHLLYDRVFTICLEVGKWPSLLHRNRASQIKGKTKQEKNMRVMTLHSYCYVNMTPSSRSCCIYFTSAFISLELFFACLNVTVYMLQYNLAIFMIKIANIYLLVHFLI